MSCEPGSTVLHHGVHKAGGKQRAGGGYPLHGALRAQPAGGFQGSGGRDTLLGGLRAGRQRRNRASAPQQNMLGRQPCASPTPTSGGHSWPTTRPPTTCPTALQRHRTVEGGPSQAHSAGGCPQAPHRHPAKRRPASSSGTTPEIQEPSQTGHTAAQRWLGQEAPTPIKARPRTGRAHNGVQACAGDTAKGAQPQSILFNRQLFPAKVRLASKGASGTEEEGGQNSNTSTVEPGNSA